MSEQQAVVVAVDDDYVTLRIERNGCGRCQQAGGCGGNSLGKLFCQTPATFRIANSGDYAVGTQVKVSVADGAIGQSAWQAYVIPLLIVLTGAMTGFWIVGEIGAMIGAAAGLFLGWLGLWRANRRLRDDRRFQPLIDR
ncbi:MAG TPA: SoxR reducing system RseC family protein [Accumulibacter sp.]|nr:SoxR reducing system RseC family protein [Accumulibacter sp.]HMW17011.1 SoxR reducing system RseC family protein [Accumulibacter sp.]HNC17263.1 SoxR reducing system RseC family protein [Accumulibacter sp.]HND79843.1 SoxR reducing system RseC family protein [Accumulibacter sp.]HNE13036.1 SoxR reducing system RseC family protein [Accumulibacter sp.]